MSLVSRLTFDASFSLIVDMILMMIIVPAGSGRPGTKMTSGPLPMDGPTPPVLGVVDCCDGWVTDGYVTDNVPFG